MLSTYQNYLFYTRNPAQTLQRTAAEPTVARDKSYYEANIGKVKSADDLLNNYQLYSFAMKAYGLSDMTYAKAFMKKVLTSDLSDANSFVNKLTDSRYKAFAQAFNFTPKGTVATSATAQTAAQGNDLASRYTDAATDTSAAASAEATYMTSAVAASTTVSDITGNTRLFGDLLKAYGLNPYTSVATVTKAIESDVSDPASFVNETGQQSGLKQLAADLHADAQGTLTAQTSTQSGDMATAYTSAAVAGTPAPAVEAAYMRTAIASLTSVGDLTGNSRLLGDVLLAYGLDPSTSAATVTAALESDTSDPASFANTSGDAGLKALAAGFNFSATGAVTTQRVAQTSASASAMAGAYTKLAGTDATAKAAAATETGYVQGVIAKANSVTDIVNDSRVVAYIGKAFGVGSISAATLKAVLTSDLTSQTSKANTLGENYANIAAAFEFTTSGKIGRESSSAVQSKASLFATTSAYLDQTVEAEAGATDTGTQLALYFARKAPSITTAYQILADPALLKVAQTVLGLPASSTVDIDVQAKQITNGIKPSDLQNPTKLNAIVSKFAALYDLANPSTDQNNISLLFGGSSDSSGGSTTSLLG